MNLFKTVAIRRSVTSAAVLVSLAIACFAHAILVDSTPTAEQVVKPGDLAIALHFNSRVDGARSQLTLISMAGDKRIALDKQKDPDRLSATAAGLKVGDYRLVWQVLAADGHLTRGQIPFRVK